MVWISFDMLISWLLVLVTAVFMVWEMRMQWKLSICPPHKLCVRYKILITIHFVHQYTQRPFVCYYWIVSLLELLLPLLCLMAHDKVYLCLHQLRTYQSKPWGDFLQIPISFHTFKKQVSYDQHEMSLPMQWGKVKTLFSWFNYSKHYQSIISKIQNP